MQGPKGRVLLGLLVRTTVKSGLLVRSVLRDERRRVLLRDLVQPRRLVLQRDAEVRVRDRNKFRSKSRRDELRLIFRSMRLLLDE